MRLSTSLLLPAFITAASAISDASVYLFQGDEFPNTSNPPTLSPEQARLVFAQRLGASQYHGLGDASAATLSYINKFGGQHEALFQESVNGKAAELVFIVEGVSSKTAEPLLHAWSSIKPAFSISNPPPMAANVRLGEDMSRQLGEGKTCPLEDAINPFEANCWNGKSKVIHLDLVKNPSNIDMLMDAQERLVRFANQGAMNVLVVLMPESSRLSKNKKSPYGSYEMPSQVQLSSRQVEEPMNDLPPVSPTPFKSKQVKASNSTSDSPFEPITGVPPLCHPSLESCTEKTNKCSGHGECYKKRGKVGGEACFTCGCTAQNETFIHGPANRTGIRLTYWGGAACQKKDVSGPFWLIAISSVVMVGLVSWSIGLLFSIGEEKLPGVIGAGVSTNRAR